MGLLTALALFQPASLEKYRPMLPLLDNSQGAAEIQVLLLSLSFLLPPRSEYLC